MLQKALPTEDRSAKKILSLSYSQIPEARELSSSTERRFWNSTESFEPMRVQRARRDERLEIGTSCPSLITMMARSLAISFHPRDMLCSTLFCFIQFNEGLNKASFLGWNCPGQAPRNRRLSRKVPPRWKWKEATHRVSKKDLPDQG
jgi:hypothetical protein